MKLKERSAYTVMTMCIRDRLFPGYVLVKMVMNDDHWYVVRNTRGCTGFVGPASKPVPLSAEEVCSNMSHKVIASPR